MTRIDENTIKLCTRGSRCCPIVSEVVDGKNIGGLEISDDYGGKVSLTSEERRMLLQYLSNPKEIDLNI